MTLKFRNADVELFYSLVRDQNRLMGNSFYLWLSYRACHDKKVKIWFSWVPAGIYDYHTFFTIQLLIQIALCSDGVWIYASLAESCTLLFL